MQQTYYCQAQAHEFTQKHLVSVFLYSSSASPNLNIGLAPFDARQILDFIT